MTRLNLGRASGVLFILYFASMNRLDYSESAGNIEQNLAVQAELTNTKSPPSPNYDFLVIEVGYPRIKIWHG